MLQTRSTTGSIAYEASGPSGAPALLLSNSLGATSAMWDPQMPVLATRFRVVRYDTRGHGQSIVAPGPYAIEQLGEDALAVLDACGADTAHICGLSLGGVTAMWLAVHAPERVDRLVLANTAAKIGTTALWDARMLQVRREGMPAIADQAIARWFTPAFIAREPMLVAAVREMIVACHPDGYAGCCAALRDADLRDDLSSIHAQTLVITATHDPATPPGEGRAICERIAGARYIELDCAHLSNVEQSEPFNGALIEFLTGEHCDG